MSLTGPETILLRISKAANASLISYKEGVHLESASGRAIDDLHQQACADRIGFADQFLQAGDRMLRSRPPLFRVAVGRYYYAMYHTMRAVVYYKNVGDDFEKHSVLPTKTPSDFVQRAYWENELKDARFRRNEADYDPYPDNDLSFKSAATHMKTQAHDLLAEARRYLKSKGCGHV